MNDNYPTLRDTESTIDKKKKGIVGLIIWATITLILALSAFFFANNYIMRWPIKGSSMEPTIQSGDTVLLFRTQNADYGDVIVFYYPELDKYLIKRVVGKANDVIKTEYSEADGCFHIYRNGEKLDETFLMEPMASGTYVNKTITVPKNYFYVLGDNRNVSYDSHNNIFASKDQVQGIAFIRFDEENHFEIIKSHDN